MKLALVHLFQIHLQILTDSAALVIHQLENTQREHRMSVLITFRDTLVYIYCRVSVVVVAHLWYLVTVSSVFSNCMCSMTASTRQPIKQGSILLTFVGEKRQISWGGIFHCDMQKKKLTLCNTLYLSKEFIQLICSTEEAFLVFLFLKASSDLKN